MTNEEIYEAAARAGLGTPDTGNVEYKSPIGAPPGEAPASDVAAVPAIGTPRPETLADGTPTTKAVPYERFSQVNAELAEYKARYGGLEGLTAASMSEAEQVAFEQLLAPVAAPRAAVVQEPIVTPPAPAVVTTKRAEGLQVGTPEWFEALAFDAADAAMSVRDQKAAAEAAAKEEAGRGEKFLALAGQQLAEVKATTDYAQERDFVPMVKLLEAGRAQSVQDAFVLWRSIEGRRVAAGGAPASLPKGGKAGGSSTVQQGVEAMKAAENRTQRHVIANQTIAGIIARSGITKVLGID